MAQTAFFKAILSHIYIEINLNLSLGKFFLNELASQLTNIRRYERELTCIFTIYFTYLFIEYLTENFFMRYHG